MSKKRRALIGSTGFEGYAEQGTKADLIMDLSIVVVTAAGTYAGYAIGRRAELGLSSWMSELRAWSSQVIEIFAKAEYLVKQGKYENEACKSTDIVQLCSLVETGRLYFPNMRRDEHGQHKFPASRGFRHPVLDPVVAAIQVIEDSKYPHRTKILKLLRKKFISLMDEVLAPGEYNRKLVKIIEEVFDRHVNKNLMSKDEIPNGAEVTLKKMALMVKEGKWKLH